MNNTKMLNFLIKFVFLTVFFYGYKTHSQISINKWVIEPNKEQLYKPLIYVDFWATWCAPCISSMPHTQGLEEKFGDKVFFVYISSEPENKIKSFMTGRNLTFYAASDTDKFNYNLYEIDHLPTSIILDPHGKTVWRGKPGELNEKILKKLISKYGYKKGKKKRIKLKKNNISNNDTNERLIKGKHFSLKYQKFDYAVPFNRTNKNNKIIYQGDLKSILAAMFSVKPYQIQLQGDLSYWKIIFEKSENDTETSVAGSFLQSAGFEWQFIEKKKEVFQLKERDTLSWLNSQLYQYTESPNQNLSMMDDYFLTVDNASPGLLADILSEKTPWIFTYKGGNNQIYDWNIQIDNLKNLLKNLTEDLNFKVKKKRKKIQIYIIKKK